MSAALSQQICAQCGRRMSSKLTPRCNACPYIKSCSLFADILKGSLKENRTVEEHDAFIKAMHDWKTNHVCSNECSVSPGSLYPSKDP